MDVLKYIWGKACKAEINGKENFAYHPLVCHLIDAVAVAEVFWDEILSDYLKTQLDKLFFDNYTTTRNWFLFITGLHDLGKATPVFQSLIPELAEKLHQLGLKTYSIKKYHSILSGELFYRHLISGDIDIKIDSQELLFYTKYIIGGHHGVIPKAVNFSEIIQEHLGDGLWKELQKDLIKIIATFSGINQVGELKLPVSSIMTKQHQALLIFVLGFISVIDWIASNEGFFNFFTDFENIRDLEENYFKISRKRAKEAIAKIGWTNWNSMKIKQIQPFKKIFPLIRELRPMQDLLINHLEEISSPCLVIIEAPMGEGKTEAALYLEHYLEENDDLQGTYIALPTQATANQMFTRVKEFLSYTKKGIRTNLHLLHGNAILSDKYCLLKTNSKNYDEEESYIVADEWFTFRKRGLISPFGVGTIDQILLSVLPIKHFFVRLFGLAGKVIIVDEVHSYDVYMSVILEYLLYWLKLLGSSVVLLSATLPSIKRKKLIQAYYAKNNEFEDKPYPRMTICNENQIKTLSFDVSLKKQGDNSVLIKWIDESSLTEKLRILLEKGGRIAIVCNKVRRAQELYTNLKTLKESGITIELLHSRFPFIQRNEIERSVLKEYGKNCDHTQAARILVSTQIIEQSLDLDFDLIISDLAPMDLLFQRMGRLHRHTHDNNGNVVIRPKKMKRPEFWLIKPNFNEYSIPKFSYPIYSKYILLKTFLHLWPVKSISIPDDIEEKIELVYGDYDLIPDFFKKVKKYWEKEILKTKDAQDNLESMKILSAKYKLISNPSDEDFFEDFSVFLEENSPEAQESLQSLTRVTRPSISLVCLYKGPKGLYLDKNLTRSIDLNEVPNQLIAKDILDYSIKISNYQIFKYFSSNLNSIPNKWKKTSLVSHIHYVILTQDSLTKEFYFDIEQIRIYLKDELGIYINY